jgi:hypothetical protein
MLGQTFKNTVLNVTSSLGSLSILRHNDVLLLGQIGHFLRNELTEHLLFKTEGRNSEIKQSDLDLSLRSEMRVRNGRCHKESEIVIPSDRTFTKTQVATLVNLFEQDGLKGRIQIFRDILNQEPATESDTQFNLSEQGRVRHLDEINAVWSLVQVF